MKTDLLSKLILIFALFTIAGKTRSETIYSSGGHYWSYRPSSKQYFWMYWRGMRGAFTLLANLHTHPYFRNNIYMQSWMRRHLCAYIRNKGVFYILSIRLFFTPNHTLAPGYNPNHTWRRLEDVTDADKERAQELSDAFNNSSGSSSNFFELGVKSSEPIVCLETESGNVPGKILDNEKTVYVDNGEVKECSKFYILPETELHYNHQNENLSCAPRGYNTKTKEVLWNGVYFGSEGNILGSVNSSKSVITYVENGEVKTSDSSFAVLC